MSKLRAYIAHDRLGGSEEGAVLVFAHTAREARRLAWPYVQEYCGTWEWIDMQVRWIRSGADYHRVPGKEEAGEPYVVDAPEGCEVCMLWYADGLDDRGLCESCAEEEEELLQAHPEPLPLNHATSER